MQNKTNVIQIEHNAMWYASVVLTILFAWIIFPYKWSKMWRLASRKRRAMAKAKRMSKKTDKVVYVCQWDDVFFTGTREEMKREIDRKYKNYVSNRVSHYLDVDFRKAIIARAKGGEIMEGKNNDGK